MVLVKAGATVRYRSMLYKAVVQTALLYVSESWVITGLMMNMLERFCHFIARRIAWKTAWSVRGEGWEYPPEEEDLEAAGLWTMQDYLWRQKCTIEYYIVTAPIYELCTWV